MKPEIAQRLVQVLEYGNHKKTSNKLGEIRNGEYKFCCLGVLCEVYNDDRKFKRKKQLDVSIIDNVDDIEWFLEANKEILHDDPKCKYLNEIPEYEAEIFYNNAESTPPQCVNDWAGLSDEEQDKLIDLNDNNKTWTQVIKYLKTFYESKKSKV